MPTFRLITAALYGALLFAMPAGAATDSVRQLSLGGLPPGPEPSRQVILIIGDGMDDQQITAARNYLVGVSGRLLLDKMPLRSTAQVLTVSESDNPVPLFVSDSANTATSMATGELTSRGRLATRPGNDEDIPTIVEQAAAAGYRTGLVTTASVTDATPASFAAHISFRMCENPDMMTDIFFSGINLGNCRADMKENGGPGSISEQLAASPLDVILGGGAKHFRPMAEGSDTSVLKAARDAGFRVVRKRDALLAASNQQGRLLGLFSPSTMPVRWRGERGRKAEFPQTSFLHMFHPYLGSVTLPEPMACQRNPGFVEHLPSLKEMTEVALARLHNKKGFFLMIESASIDKQAHERKPCGSIGELEQLEEALASALAYARKHPNTLVLVTADHSQAAQIIPDQSLFARYPIPTYTPGKLARIRTPEGQVMAINYASTNFAYAEHTGANVPLFANREGRGRVPAYVTQPEIYNIMADYLQLDSGAKR
ncbi:MAG: alkaline phosphatase [Pseudomonadota bacterium]